MNIVHLPVMLEEVLEMLSPRNDGVYVDATLGTGGHSEGILRSAPGCSLVGIDRDEKAVNAARERLKGFRNVHVARDRFSNITEVVNGLGYEKVNGILIDAGVSSLHLKEKGRGFSFLSDDPLDMRMDRGQEFSAADVVNVYPEKELADIIWKYGDERYSRRIAKAIVYARRKKPINTCMELAGVVERAVRKRGRIHPATRTFQAIRIEVNKELDELATAVSEGAGLLEKGGRYCVISYHSLEDRIVKNIFRDLVKEGKLKLITKKPLVPGYSEKQSNPSSRSAKLRTAEKI